MKTVDFFDLTGGIDARPSYDEVKEKAKATFWNDATNVVLDGQLIKRCNGCTNILNGLLPTSVKIVGIAEYKFGDSPLLMINTDEGKLYLFNQVLNKLIEKHSSLSNASKYYYTEYNNKLVVCNGHDETFLYDAASDSIVKTGISSAKGVNGSLAAAYAGRLFIAEGSDIYWSALGNSTDWITENDAGYALDIDEPITGMISTNEYIVVWTVNSVYLFTGTEPANFQIQRFGDTGLKSRHNVCRFNNDIYFYSDGLRTIKGFGDLGQSRISNELTTIISKEFDNIDSNRLQDIILVPYHNKKQIWMYLPQKNQTELSLCWVIDFQHSPRIVYYKRKAKPIIAATFYNGKILTGSSSGKLYQEDKGDSFDGTNIESEWISPWFSFKERSQKKTAKSLIIWHDSYEKNNYNLQISYDSRKIYAGSYDINLPSNYGTYDNAYYDKDYYVDNDRLKIIKGINKRFNSVQIKISSALSTDYFSIYGFSFENVRHLR